jgi:hypothetical protein
MILHASNTKIFIVCPSGAELALKAKSSHQSGALIHHQKDGQVPARGPSKTKGRQTMSKSRIVINNISKEHEISHTVKHGAHIGK